MIGKTSFAETQLVENYATALDEILRAKPSAAKGRYIKKIAVSTTMGPGILVDPARHPRRATTARRLPPRRPPAAEPAPAAEPDAAADTGPATADSEAVAGRQRGSAGRHR